MAEARGLPRPFWDEAKGAAANADCVRRVRETLAQLDTEDRVYLFVPDPPTPLDLARFDLPPGAQTQTWGTAGRAVWTGDEAVADALIAPMFELRSDWLYIIAMAKVGESPTLQEENLASWLSALVGGEDHTGVPRHILLVFEWGDFAPPPVSSVELAD